MLPLAVVSKQCIHRHQNEKHEVQPCKCAAEVGNVGVTMVTGILCVSVALKLSHDPHPPLTSTHASAVGVYVCCECQCDVNSQYI